MTWEEGKIVVCMLALLTIPGWAVLSVGQVWKRWEPLQRWIIAVGLSISFYPILFYLARLFFPGLQLGARKISLLLLVLAGIVVWLQRKDWRRHFAFDRLEWITILVFALTIFTRLWLAHLYPYPAWSDSLHHSLLTQLVAQSGRLPYTLDPYEPASLNMYHLGLYSLTGVLEMLAHIQATTALLWFSQLLSGICGFGVYLVVDRMLGRRGALVGAVVAGLISFQPALYFSWGRFTQVAGQATLLIAWVVTFEALRCWRTSGRLRSLSLLTLTVAAGLLNAGLFLLHFRVAGLYMPLLALAVIWELYQGWKTRRLAPLLGGLALIGALSLLLVLPALLPSMQAYIAGVNKAASANTIAERTSSLSYYDYSIEAYFTLGATRFLTAAALLSLVYALYRRSKLALAMLLWFVALWLIGNAYRTGLVWLSFVNYTGIMIMFYLPYAVITGVAAELLLAEPFFRLRPSLVQAGLAGLLFWGVVSSHMQVANVESWRFFLTPADLRAMDWINNNIPQDAVFAVNTYLWMDKIPHGTDGGYWIPYFTGRKTTTGTMMFTSAPENYGDQVLNWSKQVHLLSQRPDAFQLLCDDGVKYAYVGTNGNFSGSGLDAEKLASAGAKILYAREGVSILSLCNP